MEVMALAALAAQSHDETTTSPAVSSPAMTKEEPEVEPTSASTTLPSSPASAMKSDEEYKVAIAGNNDVEMECNEEAADAHELDDESNQEEEEEEPRTQAYKTDRHGRLNQDRLRTLDPAPVREYPEELASAAASSSSSSSPWALSSSSPQWPSSSKRKRLDTESSASSYSSNRIMIDGIDMGKPLPSSTKRKGSSDFLRKGQWTPTEERLARLLIEAFEEGYLPIFTGIRLRGYLAVQLQCDPMRISKKLCAGTIDGKKIPKNYGQKKFRLRKKLLWDREQAGRILATLERLTRELWAETGIPLPSYLTLSSTRSLCPEEELLLTGCVSRSGEGRSKSSPVKKLSPPANKSKKQKNGVVFPIIYLNLSKKTKQSGSGKSSYDTAVRQYGLESPYAESEDGSVQAVGYPSRRVRGHGDSDSDAASSTSSSDEGGVPQPVRVDGESLQAAYDLLNLQRRSMSPVSSRCSTPCPSSPTAKRARREEGEDEEGEEELSPVRRRFVSTPPSSASSQTSGSVPIRPTPTKPTILRQQAPTVSS